MIKCLNEFLTNGTKPSDKRIAKLSEGTPVHEKIAVDECQVKGGSCANKYPLNVSASTSDATESKDVAMETQTHDDSICKIAQDAGESVASHATHSSNEGKVNEKKRETKAKYLRMKKSIEKLMRKTNCSFECAKRILEERRSKRCRMKGHLQKSLEERMSLGETVRHRIAIKFVSTSADAKYFEENVLPVEHKIYLKYQCAIHDESPDTCEVKHFKRFLVDSTLKYEPFNSDCTSAPVESLEISGYGSFHMQYWLDDLTLLAVSVIDITSFAFSSVYFFYDPDYSFLSLGTLSALYELKQVRALSRKLPSLKYYYMGYYIDSCQKMRYKKQFKPSFLLCPEAKTWHPIQHALPKLQFSKYSRLNEDTNARDVDESIAIDYRHIQVTLRRKYVYTFREILSFIEREEHRQELEEEVTEYVSLVGRNFAKTVVLWMPG